MPTQTTSINANNSGSFQGLSTIYPGGAPAPFPGTTYTWAGIYRPRSGSLDGTLPTYQCLHMMNALGNFGTCNQEVLIYGPTGDIILGGYDQIIPNQEYTLITGADRALWTAFAFSWDGTNRTRFRWRKHGGTSWSVQDYGPQTNDARGPVTQLFNFYGAEQAIDCESLDLIIANIVLTDAQLDQWLAADGDIPAAWSANVSRHYKQASAANFNVDVINGYNGTPNGTSIDSPNSPFPWPGLATGPTLSAATAIAVSSTTARPRVTFDFP